MASNSSVLSKQISQRSVGEATRYGAIAQMGERLICIQEVGGSIPPGSTMWYQVFELCLVAIIENFDDVLVPIMRNAKSET